MAAAFLYLSIRLVCCIIKTLIIKIFVNMIFSRILIIIFLAAMGAFYFFWPAKAADFDANNIISDQEILDYETMDLADIQKFF